MPPQKQPSSQPDFIPAQPDFIPAGNDFIPASTPAKEPGFLESFGKQFGLDHESAKADAEQMKAHPIQHAFEQIPGMGLAEGLAHGAMRSASEIGHGLKDASEGNPWGLASHAISAIPFAGPAMDKAAEQAPPSKPGESYLDRVMDVATNPGAMGTLTGAATQIAPLIEASGMVKPIRSGLSAANQAFNPLPLRSRAVEAFRDIEAQNANTPVPLNQTTPAIDTFRNLVRTGSKDNTVVRKLGTRVDQVPTAGDPNFPEARRFYENVTTETKKPGFLRRAMEDPSAPKMRRNVGGVKDALNSDVTNALPPDQATRYTGAMKEYANNAKLRRLGLIGAGFVGEELARRTGLLGKIVPRVLGQ